MRFQFKQFEVEQGRAAMKVGTDGVLLGAWVALAGGERRILDVGTGTGVIALMLAQRSAGFERPPHIDAVEIEAMAADEAAGNFSRSPWFRRLRVVHGPVQEFGRERFEGDDGDDDGGGRYDLIVSNPPYFAQSLKPSGPLRAVARHTERLSYSALIEAVLRLLRRGDGGRFATIFPPAEFVDFARLARESGLHCHRSIAVRGRAGKAVKRVAGEFALRRGHAQAEHTEEETLCIEDEAGFTDDYKHLTQDFYLKF